MLKLLLCLIEKLNVYIVEFQTENLPIVRVPELLKKCVVKAGSYIFKELKGDFSDDDIREEAFNKLLPFLNDQKKYGEGDPDPFEKEKRSMEEFRTYFEDQDYELKNYIAVLSK